MKVIEAQPTPNPNAIKLICDGQLSDKPLSFFNAEAGQAHPLASKLFGIKGVTGLLILNDFVTVSKASSTHWRDITPAAKRVIAESAG